MAITFRSGGRLTATTAGIPFGTAKKFTLSLYFRVNVANPGQQLIARFGEIALYAQAWGTGYRLLAYSANNPPGGAASAAIPDLNVGVVYHAAIVYDPSDAARRFMVIHGTKAVLNTPGGPPLNTFTGVTYGGGGAADDVTVQHAFFLGEYAASDDEIEALYNDVSAASALVSAVTASPKIYHSLEGEVGVDVTAGAPGVSSVGYNGIPSRPNAGSVVRFSEPMPTSAALAILRAYIGSSGRTLTVQMSYPGHTQALPPRVSDLTAPLAIRIDDGPPIQLPTTAATGAYAQPNADAIILMLPAGVSVSPGQRVTLDAPENWFSATVSFTPAVLGYPVANYSGKPISDGLWPDAGPIRVGSQNEGPGRVMAVRPMTNIARYISFPGNPRWPDGTYRNGPGGQVVNVGTTNGIDIPGVAGRSGIWILRWDDVDVANPVTMRLTGSADTMRELVEYRNDGDALGRGKVRVYALELDRTWTYTLASDIDAAATEIPFTVTGIQNFETPRVPVITIGDESIRGGGLNHTTKRFTSCERGWRGSTATSHAAGTPFTVRWGAQYTMVSISTTAPDQANTRYANLGIYEIEPSELPTLQPGEKFEYPFRDPMEVSRDFKRYVEDGVGALRYMSETPGMAGDTEHPEQYTLPDDPHLAGAKFTRQFFVESVEPFDMAKSPYLYTPTPWPGTERYTAVLGSPIMTAPPSGTVETITLTGGRAAPVVKGQSLFAGDEVMRVLEVPLAGDLYRVERGSLNTPTSTHPAGEIEVGYRVPLAAMSQFVAPNGRHLYEAKFDMTRSAPPEFGHVVFYGWDGAVDANVTARRSLKLTAPLNSTATAIFAAPADPGDWTYIARNLRLLIGAETLTVTAVDAAAGKITVAARTGASYPAGTTLTTRSSGVLLQSPDGTKRAYNGLFAGAAIVLATGVDRALILTSDESTGFGIAGNAAMPQTFDTPNTKTKPTYFPITSHPYEFTARETAASPGAWHWLNVPWRGTDAAVYAAAKAVRDNLPPGRTVVFELGNELWNANFQAYGGMYSMGLACRMPSVRDMYIARTKSAFEVAKRCFAEVGRGDEILMSICWQTSVDILADCRRLGVEPDVVAMAPYLFPSASVAAYTAVFNAADNAQACDLFTFHMLYMTDAGTLRGIGNVVKNSLAAHEKATGKRPIPATYEGGVEKVVGLPTNAPANHPLVLRARDVVNHPSFYFTERDSFAAMREVGNVEIYMQLALAGPAGQHLWAMLLGPNQKAGYGDGRDGGVNNLEYSSTNPTDPLKGSGDGVRESVRLQAWLDHQRGWRATNSPDPDPTEPVPNNPWPNPDPSLGSMRKPYRLVVSRFRPRFR